MRAQRHPLSILVAVAALASACTATDTGSDTGAANVRNVTLPSVPSADMSDGTTMRELTIDPILAPDWQVTSFGDGHASVERIDVYDRVTIKDSPLHNGAPLPTSRQAIDKMYGDLRLSGTPSVVDVSLLASIDRITKLATAAPVIVRLPVPFDPLAVGESLRAGTVKSTDRVWKGSAIRRGTNDPAIAAATIALHQALSAQTGFARPTVDLGLAISAAANAIDPTVKVAPNGQKVSPASAFAQLGVVPYVRLLSTGTQLRTLLSRGLIAGVELNPPQELRLEDSTDLVQSVDYTSPRVGRWDPEAPPELSGTGVTIAVLDTGVDSRHPALDGRLVDEACFVDCGGADQWATSTEVGSGGPCDLSVEGDCDHGTHVAGIVLGAAVDTPGNAGPSGVAPAASLISYRVCAGRSCPTDAVVAALGRVATLTSQHDIAAVNMSVGLGGSACPNGPWTRAIDTAIIVLLGAEVISVQAGGNGGRSDYADCVHPVLMVVANATKDDTAARNTDFSSVSTDLWAPGVDIAAASLTSQGEPTWESKSGTSMAAPHVAGALALVRQGLRRWNEQATTDEVLPLFGPHVNRMLGIDPTDDQRVMITDDRNSRTTARSAAAPRLSLHRLVELALGPGAGVAPRRLSDAEISARDAFAQLAADNAAIADRLRPYRPRTWTVNDELPLRRTIPSPSFPMSRTAIRTSGPTTTAPGRVAVTGSVERPGSAPPANALAEPPRLVVRVDNAISMSARTSTGQPLPLVRLSRGPLPCLGDWGGWVEFFEMELPADSALAETPWQFTVEGVSEREPAIAGWVQWMVASDQLGWRADEVARSYGQLPSERWNGGVTVIDNTPVVMGDANALEPMLIGDSSITGTQYWAGAVLRDARQFVRDGAYQIPDLTPLRDPYELGYWFTPRDETWSTYGYQMVKEQTSPTVDIGWRSREGVHQCRVALQTVWVAGN